MYKFIKNYNDYLLQLVTKNHLYVKDNSNELYFIFDKKMTAITELSDIGRNVRVVVLDNYLFWIGNTLKKTRVYSRDGKMLFKEFDFKLRGGQSFYRKNQNPFFLFFSNKESYYYQITPETWEVEKIPYPDQEQYYHSSFGQYIIFKTKDEKWFVYQSSLDNLIWSGDYSWANCYEYNGKIEESSSELSFYPPNKIILSYNSSRTFCINLLTKKVEWTNQITGKYLVVGNTAYVHPGLRYIATVDLKTGAITNKKKTVDQLSPMSRYVDKYAPAPNAGVTYHDGLLWGMSNEGKDAFIGAYDPDTYQLQWSTQLPGIGEIPQYIYFLEDYLYVRCAFGNLYVYQKETS